VIPIGDSLEGGTSTAKNGARNLELLVEGEAFPIEERMPVSICGRGVASPKTTDYEFEIQAFDYALTISQ
jgi:hypothetical protein